MVWNLNNIRGSRDTVKAKLAGESIPQDVKDFICAQIDSLPADVTSCKLDSYCQDVSQLSSLTMTRNVQITIVGIKL